TDEYVVLDGDALADETVRRDLASLADRGTTLYFHECADSALVADRTPIEVDQLRVKDLDALAKQDVLGNRHDRPCASRPLTVPQLSPTRPVVARVVVDAPARVS